MEVTPFDPAGLVVVLFFTLYALGFISPVKLGMLLMSGFLLSVAFSG